MSRRVLVVEDDEALRERLVKALARRQFDAHGAASVAEALRAAEADPPELAAVDLRLPDGSGLDVLKRLLQLDPQTRVVVLTGYGSIATAMEAVRLGAVHYLTKPATVADLLAAFARGTDAPFVTAEDEGPPGLSETPSLARTEWEHIQRVLSDCGGNISEAARRLGLHRRSLQRKLAKHPVSR